MFLDHYGMLAVYTQMASLALVVPPALACLAIDDDILLGVFGYIRTVRSHETICNEIYELFLELLCCVIGET